MGSLDIRPPSAPSGAAPRKKGFFSKLFGKEKDIPPPPDAETELKSFDSHTIEDETFDIEDIRKKLGIEHEFDNEPALVDGKVKGLPQEIQFDDSSKEDILAEWKPAQTPARTAPPASFDEDLPEIPKSEKGAKSDFEIEDWTSEKASGQQGIPAAPSSWTEHPSSAEQRPGPADGSAGRVPDHSPWLREPASASTPAPDASSWTDEHVEHAEYVEHVRGEAAADRAGAADGEMGPTLTEEALEPDILLDGPEHEEAPEEPAPPVTSEEVASIADEHLAGLHDEHAQLHEEITQLLAQKDDLPDKDHPHEKPAPEGQEFILKNGQPLKTIGELLQALDVIDADVFFHHVNERKNDFASWIRGVFHDDALADELAAATSRKDLVKALKAHGRAADKKFRQSDKFLQAAIKARAERIERVKDIDGRIAQLQSALAQKSEELAEQKRLLNDKVGTQIAHELDRRLKEARADLKRRLNDAEKAKAEYARQSKTLEKRMADREARLAARQESLKSVEKTLKEEQARAAAANETERMRLEQEKAAAKALVAQGASVQAQLDDLAKGRAALAEERTRLDADREKLKADLKNVNAKLATQARQETSIKNEKDALNKREQELTRQDAQLKRDLQDYKMLRNDLERDQKALAAKEKATLARLAAEEKKAADRTRKAEDAEAKAEEKLQERRKIATYVGEAERHLVEQEQRLESEGLGGYLGRRLQSIRSGEPDMPDVPAAGAIRNLKIYSMIDQAQASLDSGDLKEARDLYNRIRDAFNKEDLSPSEKQVLYTTIRELYDDIHLAALK